MTRLELTGMERLQFRYILPAQGTLKTLNQVKMIQDIVRIEEVTEMTDNKSKVFEFDNECMDLMKNSIHFLDESKQLHIDSLPLINKILNTKEL